MGLRALAQGFFETGAKQVGGAFQARAKVRREEEEIARVEGQRDEDIARDESRRAEDQLFATIKGTKTKEGLAELRINADPKYASAINAQDSQIERDNEKLLREGKVQDAQIEASIASTKASNAQTRLVVGDETDRARELEYENARAGIGEWTAGAKVHASNLVYGALEEDNVDLARDIASSLGPDDGALIAANKAFGRAQARKSVNGLIVSLSTAAPGLQQQLLKVLEEKVMLLPIPEQDGGMTVVNALKVSSNFHGQAISDELVSNMYAVLATDGSPESLAAATAIVNRRLKFLGDTAGDLAYNAAKQAPTIEQAEVIYRRNIASSKDRSLITKVDAEEDIESLRKFFLTGDEPKAGEGPLSELSLGSIGQKIGDFAIGAVANFAKGENERLRGFGFKGEFADTPEKVREEFDSVFGR